jgi:hypothetical protein
MKIQLTKNEVYEIKMPEQIGIEEFASIVTKFNFLLKNFAKFDIENEDKINPLNQDSIILKGDVLKKSRIIDKSRWRFLRDNRNAFVEILNTYYNKSNEKFDEVLKKYNLNFKRSDISMTQIARIRELHNVKPEEVGLRKFPNKYEQVHTLRLDNNLNNNLGENKNE